MKSKTIDLWRRHVIRLAVALIRLTVGVQVPAALIAREAPEGSCPRGGISTRQSIDCLGASASLRTVKVITAIFAQFS